MIVLIYAVGMVLVVGSGLPLWVQCSLSFFWSLVMGIQMAMSGRRGR